MSDQTTHAAVTPTNPADAGNRLDAAAPLAAELREAGFPIYATRDLDRAKVYATDRFAGEPLRRFGLLASSKAKNLKALGVDNTYQATRRLKVARWFNAPQDDTHSCCQLQDVVTEFQCQGLEIDLPIVCWGDDFVWERGQWAMKRTRYRKGQVEDPFQLRTNAYRVLLTRGREGLVIWVPPAPVGYMGATVEALGRAGVMVV